MLSKAKAAEFLFGAAVEPFVIFFFVQKLFICHDWLKIVDLFLVIMLDNTCVITILRCYTNSNLNSWFAIVLPVEDTQKWFSFSVHESFSVENVQHLQRLGKTFWLFIAFTFVSQKKKTILCMDLLTRVLKITSMPFALFSLIIITHLVLITQ